MDKMSWNHSDKRGSVCDKESNFSGFLHRDKYVRNMLGGSLFYSSFIFCNGQSDRVHADLCDQVTHFGKWFEFSISYLKRKMNLLLLFCCYCICALKPFSRAGGCKNMMAQKK